MRKITKQQALKEFREYVKPSIPRGDTVWLREAWNNYTDMLCKDKRITVKQYESWSNPF